MRHGCDFVLFFVSRRPGGKHRRIDSARTLIEIRMFQSIERRDPFRWVVGEKSRKSKFEHNGDEERMNGLVDQIESFLGE